MSAHAAERRSRRALHCLPVPTRPLPPWQNPSTAPKTCSVPIGTEAPIPVATRLLHANRYPPWIKSGTGFARKRDSRAAIPSVVALAKPAMWAGFVVVSGRRGHLVALARLEFPPLEIFAQRKLQPLLPRALGRPRALPSFALRLVRHLQVACHRH